MASDFGLTTRELSPSASLSSTGRREPRLERGGPGFLPKAAARPDLERVGGERAEVDGRVGGLVRVGSARVGADVEGLVGVARLVHGFGSVIRGSCFPRIRAGSIFAQEIFGKGKEFQESAFKRLAASSSSSTALPGWWNATTSSRAGRNSFLARA